MNRHSTVHLQADEHRGERRVALEVSERGTLTVEPKRTYTVESLMSGYRGPKLGEYDRGAPEGKEMW